ncbi:acyltransferase family protein [Hymenobacter weizhouensis]|uniref:acyltransferase family protein n=1 Tax=Hymenobacter sp. YIM 151500-1 TaxID=2987689 RepID=UPI002226B638|nr:acyltransferase [Hymenobacter sp. YIM 151500-1]UYZ64335.1 acyltransferase [Hymenobacter sp. YIM 151500-1]
MPTTKTYAPALTGLRALAAFLVFIFHYRTELAPATTRPGQVVLAFISEFHIGVSIFFTLSGYLLCRRYFDQSPATRQEFSTFYLRRFARIYPLFFLLTVAYFLLDPTQTGMKEATWQRHFVANITLLKGFSEGLYLTGISPSWSLAVEESFYLLIPLLFVLAQRYTIAIWVLCVVYLAGLGLVLSYFVAEFGVLETPRFVLVGTFLGRSAEFLIGAAFARLLPARVPHATRLGLATLGAVLLVLVVVKLFLQLTVSIESLWGVAVNNWLLPWGTGLLLHGLATQPGGLLQHLLSTQPAQVLGKSSYAFYLLHMGMLPNLVLPFFKSHVPLFWAILAYCVLAWVLSIGLYYLVESPLHTLILRLGSARKSSTQPA